MRNSIFNTELIINKAQLNQKRLERSDESTDDIVQLNQSKEREEPRRAHSNLCVILTIAALSTDRSESLTVA